MSYVGSAGEFCLLAGVAVVLPTVFTALVAPLRQAWPRPADTNMELTDRDVD